MYKLYQVAVIYRGKLKKISELGRGSDYKIGIKCPHCGKQYKRYFKVLKVTGNFLCQKCSIIQRSEKILTIGDRHNKLTILGKSSTGKSVARCDCGKEVVISNWNIVSGKTQSCGCITSEKLKKFYKENPTKLRGENHPNWKGGISGERSRDMVSSRYKEWRSEVFKRDDYTCQRCFKKGYNIEAHHIIPYSKDIRLSTIVSNGLTLCKSCHKKVHNLFGIIQIGIEKILQSVALEKSN